MNNLRKHVFFMDEDRQQCEPVRLALRKLDVRFTSFPTHRTFPGALQTSDCDLIIADISQSGLNGLSFLQQSKSLRPGLPIVLMIDQGNVAVAVQAVKLGAEHVVELPSDRESLSRLVNSILGHNMDPDWLAGKSLTKAESRILRLIIEGYTNKKIALMLHRSIRTVEEHRRHIMGKLKVHNVVDLVKVAAFTMDMAPPEFAEDSYKAII